MPNLIASAIARIEKLPKGLQNRALNFAFRRAVPFVGRAKVHYEKVSEREWIAHVPNKRSVQNHMKQVHAGALGNTALPLNRQTNFSTGRAALYLALWFPRPTDSFSLAT